MRIVVSGYVGTGKTSLCEGIAARHALPIIAEGFVPLVEAEGQFTRQARQVKPGDTLDPAIPDQLAAAYRAWADDRRKAYESMESFVADRWEVDLITSWLARFVALSISVDKHTDWLLRDMRDKAATIDLAIVTPLQPMFQGDRSQNEAGLLRAASLTRQVAHQASIDWLSRRVGRMRVLDLPVGLSLEQRLDRVDAALARLPGKRA